MSIKINTKYGEVASSKSMNDKIGTLYGSNAIIHGFNISKLSNTSINISPGKAIVCGASIEEDRDTITLVIPSNLLTKNILYVVLHYIHNDNNANFKIVDSITDEMALIATITMSSSIINKIDNSKKTTQLNELSKISKDLSTGILDTQHLSYVGENVTINNSIRAKTEDLIIKGNTKQNLVLSKNEAVYVSADYQSGDATSHKLIATKDGCIDVAMKGRTLQNVNKYAKSKSYTVASGVSFNDVTLCDIDELNLDTKYTLIYNLKFISGDINYMKYMEIGISNNTNSIESHPTFIDGGPYIRASSNGINRISFTISDFKGYKYFGIRPVRSYSDTPAGIVYEFSNCILLKGDWTNTPIEDIPYFEGIKSAGEADNNVIEVKSHGKNLFDGQLESGRWTISEGIAFVDASSIRSKNKMNVKPNTSYTISFSEATSIYNFSEYSKGVFVNNITPPGDISTKYTFTTTSKATELNISVRSTNTSLKVQIEEGTVQSAYEPYAESKVTYTLPEPLRSLPNGVCDEITADGMLIRRVGKVIFDGSEAWTLIASDAILPNFLVLSTSSLKGKKKDGIKYPLISDKFVLSNQNYSNTQEAISNVTTNGLIYITVRKDKLITEDATGFKSWLAANPTTVYYELETPQIFPANSAILPSGVKDLVYDDKIVKKVGKVTFNISEDWQLADTTNEISLNIYNNTALATAKERQLIVSNIFESNIINYTVYKNIWISSSKKINLSIPKSELETPDVAGFKKWLAKNPTTIWYELTTPQTIFTKDLPRFNSFNNITHLISNNYLSPNLKVDSKGQRYPVLIKPNTEYTVQWNYDYRKGENAININLGGSKLPVDRNNGLCTVKTPLVLSDNNLYISGWNTKIKNVSVREGNAGFYNYHNFIESSGLNKYIEVITANKNILDLRDINFISGGGAYISKKERNKIEISNDLAINYAHVSGLFPKGMLKPNTTYTLSYKFSTNRTDHQNTRSIRIYNNNDINESIAQSYGDSITFITPKNINDIGIIIFTNLNDNSGILNTKNIYYDIQLEESSVQTLYELHDDDIVTISLNEPLRSLPNGVCDEIVGNAIIRRVGEVILDGSEAWRKETLDASVNINTSYFRQDTVLKNIAISSNNNKNIYCSRFLTSTADYNWVYDTEGLDLSAGCVIGIRILNQKLSSGIKEWLSNNPTTILYELATPRINYMKHDLNLNIFDDVSHIYSDGVVNPIFRFKAPVNLRALVYQTSNRITDAEKIVDELLLPSIIETDYERTLLEFETDMGK